MNTLFVSLFIWIFLIRRVHSSGDETDTPFTGRGKYREYTLRSNRNVQRHRTAQEINDMLEDAGSDWSESDSEEFDSEQIEVGVDADDILEYRELLESLDNGGDDKPAEPDFLKFMKEEGYRREQSDSDQKDDDDSAGPSSRHREEDPVFETPRPGKKRKKRSSILTKLMLLRIVEEIRIRRTGRKVRKVTPVEVLDRFLSAEEIDVPSRVKKDAASNIQRYREKLRKIQLAKKSLDEIPDDDIVYDFTGSITPRTSREQRKDFDSLSRQGKWHRINATVRRAEIAISQICENDDVPPEYIRTALKLKFAEESSHSMRNQTGPTATEALAHMVNIKATKRTATQISQFAKRYDLYIPGERVLRRERRKRLPPYTFGRQVPVDDSGDTKIDVGVFIKRSDMVKQALQQLLEMKHVVPSGKTRIVLHMDFYQGMDGASSHQEVYDVLSSKLTKAGHSLKSCQTFAVTLITCSEADYRLGQNGNPEVIPGEILFKCRDPNSYKNLKPLALVMEKETADLQKFLMERYPDGKVGYTFKMGDTEFEVYCKYETCKLDGKSRKAMMGRGGGYCCYCSITIEAYHTAAGVRVQDSFIEFNTEEKMREYERYQTTDGSIDVGMQSADRDGWTGVPYGIAKGIVVTHAALNIAAWVLKVAIKANIFASHDRFVGNEAWKMRGELKEMYKIEEIDFLNKLKHGPQRLVMKDVGKGNTGGGLTGNHAKKFLLHGKDILPQIMTDADKGRRLGGITELLYVVIRVLNTDSRIDLELYKRICHMIGIQVITHFPWARMNETMHAVLAHSWEVIKNNDCRGLKDMSEEGIEALQKHVRYARSAYSWLGNFHTNLGQALEALVLSSDLYLNYLVEKVPTKSAKTKPLYPDSIESSSERGGLNFLKRVIIDESSTESGEHNT